MLPIQFIIINFIVLNRMQHGKNCQNWKISMIKLMIFVYLIGRWIRKVNYLVKPIEFRQKIYEHTIIVS